MKAKEYKFNFKKLHKMTYQERKLEELSKFCEDNFLDEEISSKLINFAKKEETIIEFKELNDEEAELIVRVKLRT